MKTSETNPYAPSTATLALPADTGRPEPDEGSAWRDGNVLIVVPHGRLPERCVKCNEPAERPIKPRKVYWHHPAIYLVIVLNVLLYILVALAARRKAKVAAGLCTLHKQRRRVTILSAWVGVLGGFAMIGAGVDGSPYLMLAGFATFLGSAIAGIVLGRVVYAKRIDKSFVRLRGCGEPFLASLPRFPG